MNEEFAATRALRFIFRREDATMKCAMCHAEIAEEANYVNLDILDHRYGQYLSMMVCDTCMKRCYAKEGVRTLLNGTSRYSIKVQRAKDRRHIAKEPLRNSCGPVWIFAKSKVEGTFTPYTLV